MRPILVFLIVLLLSSASVADIVRLANGDRISGAITGLDSGILHIKTDYAGELSVKVAAVQEISAEHPLHLLTQRNDFEVSDVRVSGDELQVLTVSDRAVSIPAAAVLQLLSEQSYTEHETMLHAGLRDLWSGSATAGFSDARGNSGATSISVGMNAARISARDKFDVFFNSLFASNSNNRAGATSANSIRSGLNYAVNFDSRMFTFAFTTFETDALQQLDLRNVLGGGVGVNAVRAHNFAWDVFSGGSVDQEFYSTQPGRRSGEALFGQELTNSLNRSILLSERATIFPNLSNPGEYRVALQSSTTLKLNSWLGWQVSFNDTYVSNPPFGSVNNDLLVSTGVRFSMGKVRLFQPRSKLVEVLR